MSVLLLLWLATPELAPVHVSCDVTRVEPVVAATSDVATNMAPTYEVSCPDDVEDAEALTDLAREHAWRAFVPIYPDGELPDPPTVYFNWVEGRWHNQRIVTRARHPRYPINALQQSLVGVCLAWAEVTVEGEPVEPRVICDSGPRTSRGTARHVRAFQHSALWAFRNWRFEPSEQASVEATCFYYSLENVNLSVIEDSPCPISEAHLRPWDD